MNTFGQGFKFGLVSGLYNNMFGGCSMPGFNGYMANPFCNYSFSPMFFTPTFSFNSFTPYHSMDTFNNFSYSQNLNPFSLWSSNSYYNNPTVSTPQNQFNYDYFSSLPTLETPKSNIDYLVISTPETKPKEQTDYSSRKLASEKKTSTKPASKSKKDVKLDYSAENLKAKWEKKNPDLNLSDEFYNKIVKISKDIKCDPNDLMGLINLETNRTFDPSIKNGIGATGLIQFLPDVTEDDIEKGAEKDMVKRVGKRTSELAKMSAEEQLDYVEKYLKSHIKEKKITGQLDGATLYSLVFWPKAANQGNDYVIAKQGSRVYEQNPLLDKDKSDKAITKNDLGERLKDFIA